MAKVPYIIIGRKKVAMRCGVCEYGDDELTEKNRRCIRCLDGSKKAFVLAKKYRDAKQGEVEVDPDYVEENEHATL